MPIQVRNAIHNLRVLTQVKLIVMGLLLAPIIGCGGSGGSSQTSSSNLFSVSGTISVQRDSDVDLDLNQNNALNNDPENAQLILNPSKTGGFLSGYAGTYSNGLSFHADHEDYYQVNLVEGQSVQLSLFQADENLADIEIVLELLDTDQNVLANSQLTNFSSLSLTVPQDGQYMIGIRVTTDTSPLLYTLQLSQSFVGSSLSDSDKSILSHPFVPGQVLVRFKDQSVANHSITPSSNTISEKLKLKQDIPGIAKVFEFSLPATSVATTKISAPQTSSQTQEEAQLAELDQKIATLELIKSLNQRSDIAFAEPNFIYHSSIVPDDPNFSDQWNLEMLRQSAAWEVATGNGVVVAVLDTGINNSHEDLLNNIFSDAYDFISDSKQAGDGNGIDADPTDLGSSFHGSHVAGIISAEANNQKGIAGIAYNAKIMPIRVLGVQDTGTSSDIAQAILYAARLSNSSGTLPAQRADIINMSFGGSALSETVQIAIQNAYDQGVILIGAAGNEATNLAFYPAAFPQVIGVGSISNDKQHSGFSNYGMNVDLVAPGGTGSGSANFDGFQDAILSTVNANNYAEYIGTSMAAPHVSAVAALMKELSPSLTGSVFKSALDQGLLTQTFSAMESDPNNYFGKGLIDPIKATTWASGNNSIPGMLSIYPSKFGFNGALIKADLELTNPSERDVRILSIDEQENWLQVTEKDNVDATTRLGSYLVEVNLALSNLDQGIITVNYQIDGGATLQTTLSVFISQTNQSDSTVGTLFISLYKQDDILNENFQPSYTVGGQLNNGFYKYCFQNIEKGAYFLSASTDHDRDQLPYDDGEAFGAYPVRSRPELISINNSSLTNMNFDIQYPTFLTGDQSSSLFNNTQLNKIWQRQANKTLNAPEPWTITSGCAN